MQRKKLIDTRDAVVVMHCEFVSAPKTMKLGDVASKRFKCEFVQLDGRLEL